MAEAAEKEAPSRPVVVVFGSLFLFVYAIPTSILSFWVAMTALHAMGDGRLVESLLRSIGFIVLIVLAVYFWAASLLAMRSDRRGIALAIIPLILNGLVQIWMLPVVCFEATRRLKPEHMGYALGFSLYLLLVVLAWIGAGSDRAERTQA